MNLVLLLAVEKFQSPHIFKFYGKRPFPVVYHFRYNLGSFSAQLEDHLWACTEQSSYCKMIRSLYQVPYFELTCTTKHALPHHVFRGERRQNLSNDLVDVISGLKLCDFVSERYSSSSSDQDDKKRFSSFGRTCHLYSYCVLPLWKVRITIYPAKRWVWIFLNVSIIVWFVHSCRTALFHGELPKPNCLLLLQNEY